MHIISGTKSAKGLRFAIVVSTYHDFVTDGLQRGAVDALTEAGAVIEDLTIVFVPGAFEIPMAAQHAARGGRFDAVICLGCLIRGATAHFEYIASAVSHGIMAASAATGVPITFGVLTTNSVEDAIERAAEGPSNKGREAALAAMEMVAVVAQLGRPPAP